MKELKRLSMTSQHQGGGESVRHARCSCCFSTIVLYQPGFWNRDHLSFIVSKWMLHGILEQIIAVVPLSLYMIFFHYVVLNSTLSKLPVIVIGLILCMVGLWVFLEGLHHGLMQLSHQVGSYLRPKSSWGFNLFVAFMIGTGVTMAEPAIVALKAIGVILSVERTPHLYQIINHYGFALGLSIGLGVGVAIVIGFCKMRFNWELKPLILYCLLPTLLMSTFMSMHPELQTLVGLAWDCGAITTGEVTVPVIVALGSGLAGNESRDNPFAGLGIVTLGSLLPITSVQIFAVFVWLAVPGNTVEEVIAESHEEWWQVSGVHELIETLMITVPLIAFLMWILYYILKEKIPDVNLSVVFEHDEDYQHRLHLNDGSESSFWSKVNFLWAGLFCTFFGLYIFNVGLTKGLSNLGYGVGSMVPSLFITKDDAWGPALYDYSTGVNILFAFVFFLGYGATVAEPALDIMGSEVEILSKKRFTKRLLIHSISFGVGFGSLLGLIRIVFQIPLIYFLLPLYWLAVVLTYFSTEAILHVAWDAAAVTTGPVTVPLILGIGIATASEVRAAEGFGILALASCCPIISTLTVGILIQMPFMEKFVATPIDDEEAEKEMEHLLEKTFSESYGATDGLVPLELSEEILVAETEKERKGRLQYKGVGELWVL
eukprot:TRINITY_DN6025_c0_g1_i1.p1 TRINITY_DN6025_c0_g1~~TRINITY_DN6025_c0_g1_i1.p1  ORF type:complete len:657 (-),score=105.71 TRINITY_DN6025_c0_g1_i1:1770-3740(-)